MFPFAFFAGVVALLALPALPPDWVVAYVALTGLLGLCWRKRFAAGLGVCGACCGSLFAGYHAHEYLEARWPAGFADERVIATVRVDSIPAPRDSGWAFDALIDIDAPADLARSLRVRLIARDGSLRPQAGERWRLLLTLRPPRGRANPGAQDLERQLFRDRIHALGTIVPSSINRRIDTGHRPLAALRERISRHIDDRVSDRDASALIAALAVGDTGRVSREQWRVFNATGTTHLVAISGLHVTLFAVIAFAVARRLWGWWLWRIAAWPRESFASVFAFVAAAAYATLAGLSVPTQRTLIMLGVWLYARASARATQPFRPLALALPAVLLVDPFAPLAAGFWLSFGAMAAIILVTSGRFMRRPAWREVLSVQAVVTVALVPISFALFSSVSLVGPLVNILAIPAMSFVLVPTILLFVVLLPISAGASDSVLAVAAWMHEAGWPLLATASDVPWALIHASPPWWWYMLAVSAVAMALMPWPLTMRVASLVCVVPLAAAVESTPRDGAMEVTILDVGEGTSVVFRTSHHVIVFGTGESYGTNGRMVESVLVPFLRSRGVGVVDALVLGRASPITDAGVTALLAEIRIRRTLVGGVPDGIKQDAWRWDGVTFEMLSMKNSTDCADSVHACALSVKTYLSSALVTESSAISVEAANSRWTVVSGRRAQRPDALSTGRLGAIRFQIDPERGVEGPQAWRADRYGGQRTLWAASP